MSKVRRSLLAVALGFAPVDTRGTSEDYGAIVVCGKCRANGAPDRANH